MEFNFTLSESAIKEKKDFEIGVIFMNYIYSIQHEATTNFVVSNPLNMNTATAIGWKSNFRIMYHLIKKKPNIQQVIKQIIGQYTPEYYKFF